MKSKNYPSLSMILKPCVMSIFIFFFGMAFRSGEQEAKPKIRITYKDEDGGILSETIQRALLTEENIDFKKHSELGEESPIRILRIPEGFTETVLGGEQSTIYLEKEESADMKASFAGEVLIYKTMIKTIAALIRGASGEPALPLTEVQKQKILNAVKEDRLISLKTRPAGERKKAPSGFEQQLPGTLVMFTLMVLIIYGAGVFVEERKQNILSRLLTAPITGGDLLLGKLAGRFLPGLIQIVTLLIIGTVIFKVPLGNSPVSLLLLVLSLAFTASAIGLFLGTLTGSIEQSVGIGVLAVIIMASLGGCWWPLEIIPKTGRIIGHLFPTAWAMDGFHKLISYGLGFAEIFPDILILAGFGVFFLLLARVRMIKIFARLLL